MVSCWTNLDCIQFQMGGVFWCMVRDAWAVYSYCLWLYRCATTGAHEWQGWKMQFNLDDVTQRKVNFHFFSVSSFFYSEPWCQKMHFHFVSQETWDLLKIALNSSDGLKLMLTLGPVLKKRNGFHSDVKGVTCRRSLHIMLDCENCSPPEKLQLLIV